MSVIRKFLFKNGNKQTIYKNEKNKKDEYFSFQIFHLKVKMYS